MDSFCVDSSLYLEDIYDYMSAKIPRDEENFIIKNSSSSVHGHSAYEWIREVIHFCKLGPDDVFLDLGSGLGRPVLQVAMETNVKEARGIEISKTRCDKAKKVLDLMKKKGLQARVEFINDSFLNIDHWKGATVVYSYAVCFVNLLPQIAKLAQECKSVKYVALSCCNFENQGENLELVKKGYTSIYKCIRDK